MLQKFAFALKTKTIELFAEEEDDDEHELTLDLDLAADELITGQRVVVLKPDAPSPLPLLPSLLAALSSFRAAYLHLQSAHSPFDADALRAADRAAVSHLRRLSLFKHPNSNLTALLESQVQDNQNLLRTFDTVINRLQAEIDRKDSTAAALKQTLITLNAANARLSRRLDRASSSPDDRVETLLSVSVFDGVLKDSCRATHRFTRVLIDMMTNSGWNLSSAAEAIHPGVVYAKPGHCRYAILSYICLRMFQGFETNDFSCEEGERTRADSLRQFIEHSAVDPLELMSREPNCAFSLFCKKKYEDLVSLGTECSLFGDLDCSLESSSAVYEPFIGMASAVWTLHKLAWAYNPVVGIFQVGRGKEFSMVYVERVTKSGTLPWMAPELLSGKCHMVTEKIDVCSFGIAMWELLTGEDPYADMHCASMIGGIINNTLRPQIPTWCDPEWKAMMESCWSSEPGERPSFAEISQKLRKMAAAINVK